MSIHPTKTAKSASRAKSLVQASALALGLVWSASANATLVTENFTYSGEIYENTCAATGWITFDIGTQDATSVSWATITNFSITVSGVPQWIGAGDGTFSQSDFYSTPIIDTGGTLNFTKDLVGQTTGSGTWGVDVGSLSWGVGIGNAPSDFDPSFGRNVLVAGNQIWRDHLMNLTSLSAVPEPGNLLGLSSLVGTAAFMRVRRSKALR